MMARASLGMSHTTTPTEFIGELGTCSTAFFGASKTATMQKKGESTLSSWHNRWFTLDDDEECVLRYFDREPTFQPTQVSAYNLHGAELREEWISELWCWPNEQWMNQYFEQAVKYGNILFFEQQVVETEQQ